MKLKLLLLLILFTAANVTANSYFHPKWSPNGKQIAFYGYVDKTPEIFIADAKTGKVEQITNTKDNWEIEPRWINNNTLAIASGANMRKIRLAQLDLTTGKQAVMTGHVEMQMFVANSKTPDEMLVNWKKDQNWGLFQMKTDGSNAKQLTTDKGIFVHQVFWQQKQALATYQDNIVLLDLNGKIIKYLVKSPNKDAHPNLSSDMKKLLFVSTANKQGDIYLKDLDSGKTKRLTNDELPEYAPQFSPKNDYFVFAGVANDNMDILAMDLSGKVVKNFTANKH